jgi:hypothetical protein
MKTQSVKQLAGGWMAGFQFPAIRPYCLPTQPLSEGWSEDSSPGVIRSEREAHHSHSPSSEDTNVWKFASVSPIHLQGVVVRHRATFTLQTYASITVSLIKNKLRSE